jgi:hypothetical protein
MEVWRIIARTFDANPAHARSRYSIRISLAMEAGLPSDVQRYCSMWSCHSTHRRSIRRRISRPTIHPNNGTPHQQPHSNERADDYSLKYRIFPCPSLSPIHSTRAIASRRTTRRFHTTPPQRATTLHPCNRKPYKLHSADNYA